MLATREASFNYLKTRQVGSGKGRSLLKAQRARLGRDLGVRGDDALGQAAGGRSEDLVAGLKAGGGRGVGDNAGKVLGDRPGEPPVQHWDLGELKRVSHGGNSVQ